MEFKVAFKKITCRFEARRFVWWFINIIYSYNKIYINACFAYIKKDFNKGLWYVEEGVGGIVKR